MGGGGGRGREVVEREVAVGDGVDRVRGDLAEAQLACDLAAVGVEVDPRERPRAEGKTPGLVLGEGKARAVAREHPEVGQQVVTQIHRLRALQVGVAGQVGVTGLRRAALQRPLELDQESGHQREVLTGVQPERRRHLVVAASARVKLGTDITCELAHATLDRCMYVLVAWLKLEDCRREFVSRAAERLDQLIYFL